MSSRPNVKTLIWGIGTAIVMVGLFVLVLTRQHDDKAKVTTKNNLTITPVTKPAEKAGDYTAHQDILTLYQDKKYAEAVAAAKKFFADYPNSGLSLQVATFCLDSAVQVKDNDAKETCYKKARELAQASKDQRTKDELTKRIDAIYNGQVPASNGSTQ